MDIIDKLRPLLTDVEVVESYISEDIPPNHLDNYRTILINMAPMLDGIRSVYCGDGSILPMMRELCFGEPKNLAKLKMLYIDCVSYGGFPRLNK